MAVAGQPPEAGLVAAVLPEISDVEFFPVLVGLCTGDRITMLLDLVEQDRMSSERDALALFLVTELLQGASPPPRLPALLRIRARRLLGIEASIVLALAATALGDPDVLQVAQHWLPMAQVAEAKPLRDMLRRQLCMPPLDALPERPPARMISGFTVRRPVPKVGRNDPCPCGSSKKYKKCCAEKDAERALDPSPLPGLTRNEYLTSAGHHLTPEMVDSLRPQELSALDFQTLRTVPLIVAMRRAIEFRRFALAEQAMAALAVRSDMPDPDPDGYRDELIHAAVQANDLDVAERQLGLVRNREKLDPAILLALEVRRPSAQTLMRIEEVALAGLRDPRSAFLIDLSITLLETSPAVGILVARGSLNAQRALDSGMLLDIIEEARDRLGLPPGDPVRDGYEQMLERETDRRAEEMARSGETAERERLAAEAEALREKLRESKMRIAELERGLRTQEASLTQLKPPSQRIQPTVPITTSPPAPADEQERRRLRAKVAELKQLLSERNEERTSLRQQLAKVNDAMATETEAAERGPTPEPGLQEQPEAGTQVDAPRQLLVPRFAAPAQDALRELPIAVSRKALLIIAALAGGDEAAWQKVKQMVIATTPLFSCRVGLHHRMLFRFDSSELDVLTIIHRKDLETSLKRYGS